MENDDRKVNKVHKINYNGEEREDGLKKGVEKNGGKEEKG